MPMITGGETVWENKTLSPTQRLKIESGCAILSVVNGDVLRGGSPSLVPSRPEALRGLMETNCRRNVMWKAKGYLRALIYFYFSKTIHQISVNFVSLPVKWGQDTCQAYLGWWEWRGWLWKGRYILERGWIRVTSLVQTLESKPWSPSDQGWWFPLDGDVEGS